MPAHTRPSIRGTLLCPCAVCLRIRDHLCAASVVSMHYHVPAHTRPSMRGTPHDSVALVEGHPSTGAPRCTLLSVRLPFLRLLMTLLSHQVSSWIGTAVHWHKLKKGKVYFISDPCEAALKAVSQDALLKSSQVGGLRRSVSRFHMAHRVFPLTHCLHHHSFAVCFLTFSQTLWWTSKYT